MNNTISEHESRIFTLFKRHPKAWFSNADIAEKLKFSDRTVRKHTLHFLKLTIIQKMEVYPGFRFKWNPERGEINQASVDLLSKAVTALGI